MVKFAQLDLADPPVTVGSVPVTPSIPGRLMGDDTLWPLEPATEAKHRLYKRYLDAWWPIMLQPNQEGWSRPYVTYVDAFAGPGRYSGGEVGSPVFVLNRLLNHDSVSRMGLSPRRVRLVFVEKRPDRFEHLRQTLTDTFGDLGSLDVRVELRHGDATEETEKALDNLRAWGQPILSVFDSWGNVNVPLTLVQRLASNKSSEVIVTFGPNWFSRRAGENPDQLDAVFGGRDRWRDAELETRSDKRWRAWLATYRESLYRAGFPFRLQFGVVPKTGQPLYLVFGTKNKRGVQVMKDAMWRVDTRDGMSFRDPRTRGAEVVGQLGLFGGEDLADPELLELVAQRLSFGAVTLDDLKEWLLLETARWRERNAKVAVKNLVESGAASCATSGRITGSSVLKLL